MTRKTPDSHDFPTRPYDLVKEFVIALVVVLVLSVGLAAIFSSPDDPPITMTAWAQNAPDDVVITAVGELAGTTASATYGPPYNHASEGQKIGPLPLQKLGGVRLPVDSADLVLGPLGQVARRLDPDVPQPRMGSGEDEPAVLTGERTRRRLHLPPLDQRQVRLQPIHQGQQEHLRLGQRPASGGEYPATDGNFGCQRDRKAGDEQNGEQHRWKRQSRHGLLLSVERQPLCNASGVPRPRFTRPP